MIPADDDTVRIGVPTVACGSGLSVLASRSSPAEALRRVISQLLDDDPCFVTFSGGCDSSLILSLATEVCRASGHADPIPVTYRFARAPDAEEREYQELVVRRLGLRDWTVLDLDDDADLLGAPATSALQDSGVAWPAVAYGQIAALRQLDDGLLLTGEGGDELLGWRRVSAIASVAQRARHGHLPSRAQGRVALEELAPSPIRVSGLAKRLQREFGAEWLSPDVRRDLLYRLARLEAAEPLRARQYFEYALGRPTRQVGHHNVRAIHAQFGLRWEAPLYDPTFLGALAAESWPDFRGRTEILRRHFSEWLPVEIVERRTKARFNNAYMGRLTREFAQRWDGDGLPSGVDAEWLKDHWCNAPEINVGTALLLQRAWLATEGAPRAAGQPPE